MNSTDQFARYSRQVFIEEVGIQGQRAIMNARVLVIGVGGLGSIVLPYLAAAGVGNLTVVDFDKVEWHNLNRQIIHQESSVGKPKVDSASYFLQKLNSFIKIETIEERLDILNVEKIIQSYDIIVDCSDNFETRYLVNDTCVALCKTLVYGSIFAFEGQVAVFNYQGSKHLRDIFPEPPDPDMVPNCDKNGVLGPLPGVIGSMMAMLTLQIIVGMNIPVNEIMLFDLRKWNYTKLLF
ncbi:HesA/MoeB/ThiF family protein [Sphingobacterium sp. DN04309]|uniref:HesA/MoeB/ThiF family protein n=1 Tax=Sphingobacterium litopenaei TaxID=2763500 RepID=A0ABR7YFL3_9SPHI|nr:HesA/MoeB/ThiF family protein [Sphingobacterium litopenaei]